MANPPPTLGDVRVQRAETEAFTKARRVLAGAAISPDEALELAKTLRNELAYSHAREIAGMYRRLEPDATSSRAFELLRVEVTSTYKDPEIATDRGLRNAWETLIKSGYNPDTLRRDSDEYQRRAREVSGLAGAINKRLWEYDGRPEHLQKALHYYKQGFGDTPEIDNGYQAVNAAFVLDLLASLEPENALTDAAPEAVQAGPAEAKRIRNRLVEAMLPIPREKRSWWDAASLAEALFGLLRYEEAATVIRDALALKRPPIWEIQTCVGQLARLARIQCRLIDRREAKDTDPSWKALVDAFGAEMASGVRSAFAGKLGLALSGGGFRASLYHIGVLARLAELDLLRHIEVLSCVSGGSIVGAYFYLEVRHLLETTPNAKITREQYIELVGRIERNFLEGVQRNIRMRLFAETATSWANATRAAFSQTARLGELFEELLYSRVEDGHNASEARWLDSLFVTPLAANRDPKRPFSPRAENWMLPAKAPVLIMNATTLNTGHPWQFTASHMGEPPGGVDARIDANPRLRRVRYDDAPEGYRTFRLGHAVAASAAVPALFDPLPLQNLYAKPLLVRLCDGGVYDNQGIAGLFEQGCTFLIVSDASGQLALTANPNPDRVAVAMAANDVLMARVRGLHFDLLEARLTARTIRGAAFVHLMQDLEGGAINQRGRKEPASRTTHSELTPYGVRRDIQEQLALLRTDLDAFSEFEAHALMTSGYQAMRYQLAQHTELLDTMGCVEKLGHWRFRTVERYICSTDLEDTQYAALCRLLNAGRAVFWKLHELYPQRARRQMLLARVGGIALFGVAIWFFRFAAVAVGTLAVFAAVASVLWLIRPRSSPGGEDMPIAHKSIAKRLVALVSVVGSFAAKHYLARVNNDYLSFGALKDEQFLRKSRERWPGTQSR